MVSSTCLYIIIIIMYLLTFFYYLFWVTYDKLLYRGKETELIIY